MSQLSAASSRPASQLLASSQSQTQTQSQNNVVIAAPRLQAFQTALGQLLDTPLFANDAADVVPLVDAVNARVTRGSGGSGNDSAGRAAFGQEEADRALRALSERNKIM